MMALNRKTFGLLLVLPSLAVVCVGGNRQAIAPKTSSPSSLPTESGTMKRGTDTKADDNSYARPQEPTNCEEALLYLEDSLTRVSEIKDSYLIVIARLGEGEKIRRLNRTRLLAIESYVKRMSNFKYVLAEGSSVKGRGKIEIYVGGYLFRELYMKKDAITSCPTPIG